MSVDTAIKAVPSRADKVTVRRFWTVTDAPDVRIPYHSRSIAPARVVATWADGVLREACVVGPYLRESGEPAISHGRALYGPPLRVTQVLHPDPPQWLVDFLHSNAPEA